MTDQFGQAIDVLVAEKRDLAATRRFFTIGLGLSGGSFALSLRSGYRGAL